MEDRGKRGEGGLVAAAVPHESYRLCWPSCYHEREEQGMARAVDMIYKIKDN